MQEPEVVFEVETQWGRIALTKSDWHRILGKRPGVDGYTEHVRRTLEAPNMVFEGRHKDSLVFYGKDLLDEDPSYRACYVAVIVRFQGGAGSIRTVYFPFNVQAALGTLLYATR